MSTVTDSIRLSDMGTMLGGFEQSRYTAMPVARAQTVELDPVFPGQELFRKLSAALTRPSHMTRSEAEERAEERLNVITHGIGLAASAIAVAYLLMHVALSGDRSRLATCG